MKPPNGQKPTKNFYYGIKKMPFFRTKNGIVFYGGKYGSNHKH